MGDASPVINIHPNVDILSIHQYEKLYMMEDASPVIDIHPNVDISSTHQYENLYMMEDASPVIDIHPNVDILSTHQYEKLYMIEDASGGTSSCYGVSHSHTYLQICIFGVAVIYFGDIEYIYNIKKPYEFVSSVKLSMSSNWFSLLPNFNFEVYRRDRMASPYESVSSVKLAFLAIGFVYYQTSILLLKQ